RNDATLGQLSASIGDGEKQRGARAESRGPAQPRRGNGGKPQRNSRNDAQRNEPRTEAAAGEGRPGRRRRGGGSGWEGPRSQANGADKPRNANGHKPRGAKPSGHRKGQGQATGQGNAQAPARGDVMNVHSAKPGGPLMPARELMKHLSTQN